MSKTYTENQMKVLVANEIAAALASPSYESLFCTSIKAVLEEKGVLVNTGSIERDINNAVTYLKGCP